MTIFFGVPALPIPSPQGRVDFCIRGCFSPLTPKNSGLARLRIAYIYFFLIRTQLPTKCSLPLWGRNLLG